MYDIYSKFNMETVDTAPNYIQISVMLKKLESLPEKLHEEIFTKFIMNDANIKYSIKKDGLRILTSTIPHDTLREIYQFITGN